MVKASCENTILNFFLKGVYQAKRKADFNNIGAAFIITVTITYR